MPLKQFTSLSFQALQKECISKNYKVLIVDDNEFNVMALKFQLEKLGMTSDYCYSGKEALFQLHQQKYKMVFMDIEMPEMDGF